LPELDVLYSYDNGYTDPFLLNLFACKPETAELLSARGLLATKNDVDRLLAEKTSVSVDWPKELSTFPFFAEFKAGWLEAGSAVPNSYMAAISACLKATKESTNASQRVCLLAHAISTVDHIVKESAAVDLGVLILKVRLLHLCGHRHAALTTAQLVLNALNQNIVPRWPFLPPLLNHFFRTPIEDPVSFLKCCVEEFIEMRRYYSSCLDSNSPNNDLSHLLRNPNHLIDIDRRAALNSYCFDKSIEPSTLQSLCDPLVSKNAVIWRQFLGKNRQSA
jgi:hypothetical protein